MKGRLGYSNHFIVLGCKKTVLRFRNTQDMLSSVWSQKCPVIEISKRQFSVEER